MASGAPDQKKPALLAGVAGVLAVVAGFLNWYELTTPAETELIKGLESSAGAGTLGFGVILIVCAIVLMARGASSGGKASSIVGLICGIFILFAAGYSSFSPSDAVVQFESSDVGEQLGVSDAQAEVILQAAIDEGAIEVSAQPGAFVGIAPGALGLIAGILGLGASKRIKSGQAAPAAAPPAAAAPPMQDAPPE